MDKYGKQYENGDDKFDSYGFKKKARKHQSIYRLDILKLPEYENYGNRLCKKDAKNGFNFYNGFGIFEEVLNYQKFNENKYQALFQDMLCSEHIPFNFFVPFYENRNLLKNVFNEILKNIIYSIDLIKIEYKKK